MRCLFNGNGHSSLKKNKDDMVDDSKHIPHIWRL